MKKSTAKTVVWVSASTFLETLLLVILIPEFKHVIAAGVASLALVTALVVLFDNFYDDPADPKNQ